MKAFFDTMVIDWLLKSENLRAIQAAVTSKRLNAVAGPEVAFEVRRTPNTAKRELLDAVLPIVFPLIPTQLPRAGQARSGLAMAAGPAVEKLHARLAAMPGVNRLDSVHLLNAWAQKSDVFVTNDGDLLKHRAQLEPLLGFELIAPHELLPRLVEDPEHC